MNERLQLRSCNGLKWRSQFNEEGGSAVGIHRCSFLSPLDFVFLLCWPLHAKDQWIFPLSFINLHLRVQGSRGDVPCGSLWTLLDAMWLRLFKVWKRLNLVCWKVSFTPHLTIILNLHEQWQLFFDQLSSHVPLCFLNVLLWGLAEISLQLGGEERLLQRLRWVVDVGSCATV